MASDRHGSMLPTVRELARPSCLILEALPNIAIAQLRHGRLPAPPLTFSVAMGLFFWLCLAVVVYTYAGYPLLLSFLSRSRLAPVKTAPIEPSVSILIAAHNEEANLPRKLENLSTLDYPRDRLQIVVVSDGSTDRTNAILQNAAPGVTSVLLPAPGRGKANALNHAVAAAQGEVLVFMDARQSIDPDALRHLVTSFADPNVGAVSGELHLETLDGRPSPEALGLYWKIEKAVRKLESATGSVVGATGALFAMRRELYVPLPAGTLLDDVLTPMQVVKAGKRVLFQESAIARDRLFAEPGKEFGRKVRTLTGNYQLLQLAPWLLTTRNPILFRFISHKLLRLAVPFLLVAMLMFSGLAQGWVYHTAFFLQLALYLLASVGAVSRRARLWRPVSVAYTFVLLNTAAAKAFYNFLLGRARWA